MAIGLVHEELVGGDISRGNPMQRPNKGHGQIAFTEGNHPRNVSNRDIDMQEISFKCEFRSIQKSGIGDDGSVVRRSQAVDYSFFGVVMFEKQSRVS